MCPQYGWSISAQSGPDARRGDQPPLISRAPHEMISNLPSSGTSASRKRSRSRPSDRQTGRLKSPLLVSILSSHSDRDPVARWRTSDTPNLATMLVTDHAADRHAHLMRYMERLHPMGAEWSRCRLQRHNDVLARDTGSDTVRAFDHDVDTPRWQGWRKSHLESIKSGPSHRKNFKAAYSTFRHFCNHRNYACPFESDT